MMKKNNKKNTNIQRTIRVEVPQEIWDADMSFWNFLFMRKNLVEAWMKSVNDVVTQFQDKPNK